MLTPRVGGGDSPGDITAQPAPDNIWGEPLTEDERSLIVAVIDAGEPQQIVRWLNHVLKCYDGQAAELAAARAEKEQLLRAERYWQRRALIAEAASKETP